ncbi:MAG: HAD-IIB family hydrolase [bacterium]|nr:HAD-IIB family hydrolase [bacterium]
MPSDLRRRPSSPHILATDLDGTLIPLSDAEENVRDLEVLRNHFDENDAELVFVTGRHLELVQDAIDEHNLPIPDWIICDVGSTVCRKSTGNQFEPLPAYNQTLASLAGGVLPSDLRKEFQTYTDIRLQEEAKQGRFKLSYYANADNLAEVSQRLNAKLTKEQLPYTLIASVDPFTGDGLIDFMPTNVSKAFALNWWTKHRQTKHESIIFAGDSGNDMAAFQAGYLAIVVGNADQSIKDQVTNWYADQDAHDRLFVASQTATSGVLAGCRQFGLAPPE